MCHPYAERILANIVLNSTKFFISTLPIIHFAVYVEVGLVGNSPITLTVVTSGSGFARQWRIKVTHITCDSVSRGTAYQDLYSRVIDMFWWLELCTAANGCLQYYTGVSGTIRSFNYDGVNGRQLSNQDYTICMRTESNFCGISYTVCNAGFFSITGPSGGSASTVGTPVGALVSYCSIR